MLRNETNQTSHENARSLNMPTATRQPKRSGKPAVKPSQTPEQLITEWVGPVKDLHHLGIHDLKWDNRFRVSVYIKEEKDDCFVRKNTISESYMLRVVDGTVVDLTIAPKEEDAPINFFRD